MTNTLIAILLAIPALIVTDTGFKTEQLKHQRVKAAYTEKEETVNGWLKAKSITKPHIFIRAFKEEGTLEVWAKNVEAVEFVQIHSFSICAKSGDLGPKRKQGDRQVPEGFYHIDRFNPWSSYHLSLGINYPNASDRILGNKSRLGGDIFIHGSCVTIGCLPITDDKIKELYILCVEAKNNGQKKIPVHVFPERLSDAIMIKLRESHKEHKELLAFWSNLQVGYKYFEVHHKLPSITVDNTGKYLFE